MSLTVSDGRPGPHLMLVNVEGVCEHALQYAIALSLSPSQDLR